jgi:hypothetical protein
MSLAALTPREASIFACLCDTVVAPQPPLPPVAATDAVASFDYYVRRSPPLNRAALRALLYAVELAPRLLGFGRRLRELEADERARALGAAAGTRRREARQLLELAASLARLSYFGDSAVMRRLGYDADAVVQRGRELRTAEQRP